MTRFLARAALVWICLVTAVTLLITGTVALLRAVPMWASTLIIVAVSIIPFALAVANAWRPSPQR